MADIPSFFIVKSGDITLKIRPDDCVQAIINP